MGIPRHRAHPWLINKEIIAVQDRRVSEISAVCPHCFDPLVDALGRPSSRAQALACHVLAKSCCLPKFSDLAYTCRNCHEIRLRLCATAFVKLALCLSLHAWYGKGQEEGAFNVDSREPRAREAVRVVEALHIEDRFSTPNPHVHLNPSRKET